ncbi:tyrosine-type recombinase/integrase [Pelagibacterium lentulum]|uniref:Integrase n=1 Tax=Pelagibacterium lentulum TaxID=2029865 RepID=A0A916R9Z4_9HYPH|nr:tyrosine-type recombinase/integrase [Pelagibacterium lentulum]GGA45792.1 integrase [Pelagibacterium lentulum]
MEDYPNVTPYTDRHGKQRYRYRRKGKSIAIPGEPYTEAFDKRYQEIIEGRAIAKAKIIAHPRRAMPESLGAAWLKVQSTLEWQAFDTSTKTKNAKLIDDFLNARIVDEHPLCWRDVPAKDLKRRHIKDFISKFHETPHKAKHMLVAIRKLIYVALDEEWIETDPTYRMKWRPAYKGWDAWSVDSIKAFEDRWPIGTTPRLTFALALWLGNRRSDIVRVRWDMRVTQKILTGAVVREVDGFLFAPKKGSQRRGDQPLFIPITPMLADCLDKTERVGETVLVTAYGKPFSEKSLTGRMADWTKAAGLPKGHTLHGLRKTLGKMLAEGGASTRQLMETLGHDDIEHAELYSRAAEQARLAIEGMDRVTAYVGRGVG